MDQGGDDDLGGLVPQTKREKNSEGEDPRTLEESSKGGNVKTRQIHCQRKDKRTFEAPIKRWRVQKKWKEKKWKRKKKKKRKNVKHARSFWLRKEQLASLFVSERKE